MNAAKNDETARDLAIAQTVMSQLGRKALFMLGAREFVAGGEFHLSFRIRGSTTANLVQIRLDPSDTYTVRFSRVRGTVVVLVRESNDIYWDQILGLIERVTGLATRL